MIKIFSESYGIHWVRRLISRGDIALDVVNNTIFPLSVND